MPSRSGHKGEGFPILFPPNTGKYFCNVLAHITGINLLNPTQSHYPEIGPNSTNEDLYLSGVRI